MAKGVEFGEMTAKLGPPKGATEEEVYTLPVQRYLDNNSEQPSIISAWKFSDEEMEEITRTKIAYHSCWGYSLPPMFIAGFYPESNVRHNIYVVEDDSHMMDLAKEVDEMNSIWDSLTERQRMEVDMRKLAIQIYIKGKNRR
jgi:hypothetical protein